MIADIPFDNFQTLCVGAILFLMALLLVARSQRKATEKEPVGALPQKKEAARIDPTLRENLSDLLLRLEETSRRVNGQLETRFQTLNRLLAEADLKIRELKILSERQATDTPAPPKHHLAGDPETLEIYRHADAGLDPVEIARKMNRQRGEIDLILSLRKLGK